jgi:hypothetical protein
MKKLFTTLISFPLLLLVSCNEPRAGADGYRFGEPEFERNDVEITLVTYPNIRALRKSATDLGVGDASELMAFATYPSDPNIKRCTIHVLDPKYEYQPEWIGHETAHCFYGQWHTSNNDRR